VPPEEVLAGGIRDRLNLLPVEGQEAFFAVFAAIARQQLDEVTESQAGYITHEGYMKLITRAQELDRRAGRPVKEDMTTGEAVAKLEEAGELDALESGYLHAAMNDILWIPVEDENQRGEEN
jgi:hypothetical protein